MGTAPLWAPRAGRPPRPGGRDRHLQGRDFADSTAGGPTLTAGRPADTARGTTVTAFGPTFTAGGPAFTAGGPTAHARGVPSGDDFSRRFPSVIGQTSGLEPPTEFTCDEGPCTTISGTVYDDTGNPVSGVWMVLTPQWGSVNGPGGEWVHQSLMPNGLIGIQEVAMWDGFGANNQGLIFNVVLAKTDAQGHYTAVVGQGTIGQTYLAHYCQQRGFFGTLTPEQWWGSLPDDACTFVGWSVAPLNHVGLWIDNLPVAVEWLTAQGVRFAPGGIRKGAAGFDITFLHPKANEQFPIGGEGVLIELVQAPPEVVKAFSQLAHPGQSR